MIPSFNYGPVRYPLSVTVLSHNRLEELERNIVTLINHCSSLGYELIIADNASVEEVRSFLTKKAALHPNVVLIFNKSNRGLAGGRNSAYAVAGGEYILSIDDDTRVPYEVLRDLPGVLRKKSPFLGVLALRVKHAVTGEEQNYAGDREVPVRNHHGAACAIPRHVLARIGGIDEFFDFGSEEIDLCIRAHAAGYKILYDPTLVVGHNSFQRSGAEGLSRKMKWIFNASRTVHKYFPLYVAQMISIRYFIMTSRWWVTKGEVSWFVRLLSSHLAGCYTGLRHRSLVPPSTVTYFTDPDLVPENNGNRPFVRAMIKRRLTKLLFLQRT